MTLNIVVLPAPFGPISPVISPALHEKLTSWSAFVPRKLTDTFST